MSGFFFAAAGAAITVETPIDGQTGVWLKSGTTVISSGMSMIGAVVIAGQRQYVYNRGAAVSCTLAGGRVDVSSGGIASAYVVSNGSAVVDPGGLCVGLSAGSTGRVYLAGYAGAGSHSILSSSIISGGFIQVAYQGQMENCTVEGSATINLLGSFTILSNTIVNGGVMNNQPTGILSGYSGIYNPDTSLTLDVRGGRVTDCTFGRGTVTYRPGAAFPGSNLTILSECTLLVSNADVSGIVLSSGASLIVDSGRSALAVTSNAGAVVTVLDGGYIEYAYKRELAYLEATSGGGQYLDTGITFDPAQDMVISAKAELLSPHRAIIAGCWYDQNYNNLSLEWGSSGGSSYLPRTYTYRGGAALDLYGDEVTPGGACDLCLEYTASTGATVLTVNGSTYSGTVAAGNLAAYGALRLFRDYRPGDAFLLNPQRIYFCKIHKAGALVFDGVPVMDNADVPCMRDCATGSLIYNGGETAFNYGELS